MRTAGTLLLAGSIVLAATPAFARPQTTSQPPSREAPATTQPGAPTVKENVTVVGEAPPARTSVVNDVRALPASADVLTSRELEITGWRDPGEIVRTLPGVGYSYYGQGGIPSGPTVRGYTDRNFGQDISGHIDGIPLNLPGFVSSHGALDLTVLVPATVEHVDLLRSPVESRYGDFNRGASLDFVTRRGIERPMVDVSGGTFGSWHVTGAYGNGLPQGGRFHLYSLVDALGSDGYAENQDQHHTKLFNRGTVAVAAGLLDVTALNGWSEWDAPGYLDKTLVLNGTVDEKALVNATDGGDLQHNLFYVRYRRAGSGRFPFEASFNAGQREWKRWRHDVLIGPTQPQVHQVDDRTTWGYRVEQSLSVSPWDRPLLATVGTSLQRDDADTSQANTVNRVVSRQVDDVRELMTFPALYAQAQWAVAERVKVVGGVRQSWVDYDITDRLRAEGTYVSAYNRSVTSPKVGVVVSPARAVEVYANYARGMRSPTPRTEVRNSVGSIDRVDVAVTESYETGVTYRPTSRVDVRANVWRALNSNEIRGIPPGGTQFESLGKSVRDGAEFDVSWYLASLTRITGGLSWVDARLSTPATPAADELPDIPAYVHQVGFHTPLGPTNTIAGRFSAGVELFFYGRKNLNTTGTIRSDTYSRGTFRVDYRHDRRWRAWVGGFFYPGSQLGESEYLFGSRVGVRPNPPLSVDAGVSIRF